VSREKDIEALPPAIRVEFEKAWSHMESCDKCSFAFVVAKMVGRMFGPLDFGTVVEGMCPAGARVFRVAVETAKAAGWRPPPAAGEERS
jgi:hypothetical protein